MTISETSPRWLERITKIPCQVDDLTFPNLDGSGPSQDKEWCEVVVDGEKHRMRFHDYHKIYDVPGLYEKLFYENLKCCSPTQVVGMLEDVLGDYDETVSDLCVLDVGAGNGMVGDELENRGAERIVGIDIIPEAKTATDRDRPGVYEDYYISDLTSLPEQHEEKLRRKDFNCLTTVAALGFGDIPPAAFLKALDLISTPGWMAFNIKEDFLHEDDLSGFCGLIHQLNRERIIQIQAYRRYCHRLNMQKKPLHYVSMVARKLQDIPDHIMETWREEE